MMRKDSALFVAGFIFSIVALAHLLRFLLGSEMIVAGHVIPQNASVIGFVVAVVLAVWMFKARKGK